MVSSLEVVLAGKTIDKAPMITEKINKNARDLHQIRGGKELQNVINTRTNAIETLQMELANIGESKNNKIHESLIRGSIRRSQPELPETY